MGSPLPPRESVRSWSFGMSLPALLLLALTSAAMEDPELQSWARRESAVFQPQQPTADELEAAVASSKFSYEELEKIERRNPGGPRLLLMPQDGSLPDECANATCFRKCCPPGYTRDESRCTRFNRTFDPAIGAVRTEDPWTNLTDWPRDMYYLVVGTPCTGQWIRVDWEEYNETVYYPELISNGSMVITESSKHYLDQTTYQINQYCAEYTEDDTTAAYLCYTSIQHASAFAWLYTFGLVVSVLGLLLTLTVYVAIDSLRDLHGKTLVGHVGTLAIAYSLLVLVQMQSNEDGSESNFGSASCRGFALAIHFFLLCSLFWLHVMCIDALWAVLHATGCSPVPYPRAKKWSWVVQKRFWAAETVELDETAEFTKKEEEKNLERRVFVIYCIYVACLSFFPVLIASVQGLRPTVPSTYLDHNMKLHQCQFGDDNVSPKYFLSIVGAIEFINIIIFMVILVKACRFPWNTTGPQRVPKQKARMCFILFLLISSNWITDLIFWATKATPWIVLHAFNILEGLITFCIFVLEDRVKDCIKRQWPQLKLIKRILRCCSDKPKNEIENPEETMMLRGGQIAHSQYK